MKINKPNYGQELIPVLWVISVIILILLTAIIYLNLIGSDETILIFVMGGIELFLATLVAVSIWSSRVGKLIMRDKMIEELKLKGSENVLDVGCGRGLLTIGIAKKLASGKIFGLDHWKGTIEYSYKREMVEKNILSEGVSKHIEIVDGDALKLPFNDELFDIITSSLAMHHVTEPGKAFSEMWRVLKHDGIIAIADMPINEIRKQITTSGFEIVLVKPLVRLFFIKVKLIIAKKK